MSKIRDCLNAWEDGVRDPLMDDGLKSYEGTLLHEEWSPKWKKFQPPMWKIFRWAYNIKRTLFTGVYPVSMKTSTSGESIHQNSDGSYSLEFQCNKYESPLIDEAAKELLKSLEEINGGNNMEKEWLPWPTNIGNAIDEMFSHNEIIALWYEPKIDDHVYRLIYRGEAWATPDEYLQLEMIKFFGCIPEHILEADTVNILVSVDEDTLTPGLPKKTHIHEGCSDAEDHRNLRVEHNENIDWGKHEC